MGLAEVQSHGWFIEYIRAPFITVFTYRFHSPVDFLLVERLSANLEGLDDFFYVADLLGCSFVEFLLYFAKEIVHMKEFTNY